MSILSDGDGKITSTELANIVQAFGQNASDTEIAKMVKAVDIDGNGYIDFTEFLSMMAGIGGDGDGGQELIEEFRAFDKNGDGYISQIELKFVMSQLGVWTDVL